MDWQSVAEKIVQDDQNKWDRTVSAGELRVSQDGKLEVLENFHWNGSHSLSDLAVTQLCQKLEIPVKYYRRLPDEMKATVANFDIGRLNGHPYLLRGKGEWIRAFLSAEYVAYNNSEIAQTAESLLRNEALNVKSFVLEETHMVLKIIPEDILDREAGLNDLIVSQEKSFRHAHIYLTGYEMTRRMAEAVSEGFRLSSSLLDRFLKTREEAIDDPVETIRKIAEAREFSQKLTDETVSSYLAAPEANRFGLINAFTNAAQKLGPLQRIEMERFAGTLLEAPLQ